MPAVEKRWSAREVRDLIAAAPLATPRYELVDGALLVTPSPKQPDVAVVTGLVIELGVYLRGQPGAIVLSSPADVELEPESVIQPDIYVLERAEQKRALWEGLPVRRLLLAVEVLSPSSSRHDRVTKRPLYQRHVPEYWIVDPDARIVERWLPGDTRPEIVTQRLTWQPSGASAAFDLDLPAFFARALLDNE